MNNSAKNIKDLFAEERNKIVIPSRGEFRSILNRVTSAPLTRNSLQKGTKSPFGFFIMITKNKLILAGSVALLAIIVIIPTVRHDSKVSLTDDTQYMADVSSDTQAQAIAKSSEGTVSQDIVADILTDFAQEDALVRQEYDNDATVDDYTFDDTTITS